MTTLHIRPLTGQKMLQSGHTYHLERETGRTVQPIIYPQVQEITQLLREKPQFSSLSDKFSNDSKFSEEVFKTLKKTENKRISHKDLATNIIKKLKEDPSIAAAIEKLKIAL